MTRAQLGAAFSRDVPVKHDDSVGPEVHRIIERAQWQNAKTVAHVKGARHQYNVVGWDNDDLTDDEFWLLAKAIKTHGRAEEWTPPKGFYDSGFRRPMQNTYLYVGEYAYWFTHPKGRPPMLNREHVSVQAETPTRRLRPLTVRMPLPDEDPPTLFD